MVFWKRKQQQVPPPEEYNIGGMTVLLRTENLGSVMIADVEISGRGESDRSILQMAITNVLRSGFDFNMSSSTANDDVESFSITVPDGVDKPRKPAPSADNVRALLTHLQTQMPDRTAFDAKIRELIARLDGSVRESEPTTPQLLAQREYTIGSLKVTVGPGENRDFDITINGGREPERIDLQRTLSGALAGNYKRFKQTISEDEIKIHLTPPSDLSDRVVASRIHVVLGALSRGESLPDSPARRIGGSDSPGAGASRT